MRNIAYDCDDEELKKTLNTVGPFIDMKMLIGDDNKSKGYGFCTYNDPDTASSALRNLDKINVNQRVLHVSYASDQQSSTNLKPEDARERDPLRDHNHKNGGQKRSELRYQSRRRITNSTNIHGRRYAAQSFIKPKRNVDIWNLRCLYSFVKKSSTSARRVICGCLG